MLFRIGPFEIYIHPSWFLMFGVIAIIVNEEVVPGIVGEHSGWAPILSIGIALLFYSFVVLHEMSHATVARLLGIDARRITLFIFGGVAQIGAEAQQPADEFRIAAAGPLCSLLLAGVLVGVAHALHPGEKFFPGVWGRLGLINLFLAAFNLVPAFPMDGGRLLRAGLWSGLHDRVRATRWAANLGKGFAFLLIGGGGAYAASSFASAEPGGIIPGAWYVLIGSFLLRIADSAGRTEGGAIPRGPEGPPSGDRLFVETVRSPEPAVTVRPGESEAAEPDARRGRARSAVRPRPPRPPADQP